MYTCFKIQALFVLLWISYLELVVIVVGLSTRSKTTSPPSPAFKTTKTIIDKAATTTTESSLIAELQRCYTPRQILTNVGRQMNPKIDPSGIVSSLILVRLSKQLIGIDNNNGGISNDDDEEEEESKGGMNDIDNNKFYENLSNVVNSFSNSNWINSKRSIDSAIEGTKSASILSRLLFKKSEFAASVADGFTTTTIWLPIFQKWNEISYNNNNNVVDKLEPQQLSGLKFAFDCFQIASFSDDDDDDNNDDWILPTSIQKSYDQLQLPFRIYPSFFRDLLPYDLSVPNLKKQVNFRVEHIRTKSNTIVKERRQTVWEGDEHVAPFEYSGKSMKRSSWSPIVQKVRDELHVRTGEYYDCCLLNLYPDGGSGMRYHIDPDQGLLWGYETAVVSVGATRRFAFREINNNNDNNKIASNKNSNKNNSPPPSPHVFTLMNGDVTEMFDDCQQRYQHTVKTAENKKEKAARSSLVFKKSLHC